MSARNASAAIRRLTIEYKQLSTDPDTLFPAVGPVSEDNYLEWEALLPGPDDTPFEGGVFSARLSFPPSYPLEPPTMRFDPPLFHPNVYPDGLVCISILHAPGDDPNMYESSAERWSPVQSIEKSSSRCSACLPSRTSRAERTLTHASSSATTTPRTSAASAARCASSSACRVARK